MNADQFRTRMAQLPEPVTDKRPPYWEFWRHDLWTRAQTQDPTRFWEWPCVYHTMLVDHWPEPVFYEFSQIAKTRFEDIVYLPHFGPDDHFKVSNQSMNLIHQAYHIHLWEQTTGQRINQLDTIVEFGGGYGAMALLCYRLGFDGKYIIYDLPEFSLLQEYYLSQFGLLDMVEWPKGGEPAPENVDLFMGLYSLSEVPLIQRLHFIIPAKSYLFLYSGQWEDYDNVKWFQDEWQDRAKEYNIDIQNWKHTELTHLPDKGNHYSIGW